MLEAEDVLVADHVAVAEEEAGGVTHPVQAVDSNHGAETLFTFLKR